MWDLSSLIWVRSLPPSPEVSGKRTFPVKYYTMILQCPRIIVVDYFGFEPRSFPSDVWCASPLSQFPEYKNQEIPVFINNSFMSFFFRSIDPREDSSRTARALDSGFPKRALDSGLPRLPRSPQQAPVRNFDKALQRICTLTEKKHPPVSNSEDFF